MLPREFERLRGVILPRWSRLGAWALVDETRFVRRAALALVQPGVHVEFHGWRLWITAVENLYIVAGRIRRQAARLL